MKTAWLARYRRPPLVFPGWLLVLIPLLWIAHTTREHWQSREKTGKGKTAEYLRYVDRELWLLAGAEDKPEFWRSSVGADDRLRTLQDLRETMELLDRNEDLNEQAALCLQVLTWQCHVESEDEGKLEIDPSEETVGGRILGHVIVGTDSAPDDLKQMREALETGKISPWEALIAEWAFPNETADWAAYRRIADRQFERARISWVVDSFVLVVGMICLPIAMIRLRRRREPEMRRVVARWNPGVVLCCFFVIEMAGHWVWQYLSIGQQVVSSILPFGWLKQLLWIGKTLAWQVYAALVLSLIFFARPWHVTRAFGLGARFSWTTVPAGLTFLFALFLIIGLFFRPEGPTDPSDFLDWTDHTKAAIAYTFLTACVAAPLFEEIVYRGFLFLGLRQRIGTLPAFILSTFIFAVLHSQYDLGGLISVGTLAGVMAYLTWRTGTLLPAIFLHALYNFLIVWRTYFLYQMPLS